MSVSSERAKAGPYAGLFLVTLSTLLVEISTARLLSVVTWYHLSFFAVSLAMLGTAAGAVSVFVFGKSLHGEGARVALARTSLAFAISIPVCHVLSLMAPLPPLDEVTLSALLRATPLVLALTAPFYLSGVVVTIALTRVGGRIGRLYGADLIGAALGCLLVIPLLRATNVTAVFFAAALIATFASLLFHRFGRQDSLAVITVGGALLFATGMAASGGGNIGLVRAKGQVIPPGEVVANEWNDHSNVLARIPERGEAFFWGGGEGAESFEATTMNVVIDGSAFTLITEWDGDPRSLDWVRHGVTYLPYRLRRGNVAIIGVGGGRDVLSAVAGGNDSITGLEVNGILVDLLTVRFADFAGLTKRPEVRLVHDEARSYLSRTDERFDVIQMSLIDTWAATGAGAFALSENGLYTLEGWAQMMGRLRPAGVLSVSRWFSPAVLSETTRLLGLGTAALIERGITLPAEHLILVTRKNVATMLVSPDRFTAEDLAVVDEASARLGFQILVAPGGRYSNLDMRRIVESRSLETLEQALADPIFDFSPPTDDRPYFFNMLPLSSFGKTAEGPKGVIYGNILATNTLATLMGLSAILALLIVLAPLPAMGVPKMGSGGFAASLTFFAIIGFAFMLVQFALLQRFSVYLGHPTYSLAVVLFAMILFTGLGSVLSDRVDHTASALSYVIPIALAVAIALVVAVLPALVESTIAWPLAGRAVLVVVLTAPLSMGLGHCFPIGMRLVESVTDEAGAWMWGVNGAFSVLGSIWALASSMTFGISTTFALAALLYLSLLLPMQVMRRAALRGA
jgi:hypothetical protein